MLTILSAGSALFAEVPAQSHMAGELGSSAQPKPAFAGQSPADPAVRAAPSPDLQRERKKKRKRKAEHVEHSGVFTQAGVLRLKGRVQTRAELARQQRLVLSSEGFLQEEEVDSLDLTIPTARITLKYQAPIEWLSAEIEYDIADEEMKDAYLEAEGQHFQVTVGQFKMPISTIQMDSSWTLPVARRDVLDHVLLESLQIGGRRPGVLFEWRGRGELRPRLSAGAFQGSVLVDPAAGDRDLLDEVSLDSQSLVARAQIEVEKVEVGVFYQHRVGTPSVFETDHYATAGADLKFDREFGPGGLRIWADAFIGESFLETEGKPADGEAALFATGRLLVAPRLGGKRDDEPFVEVFVLAGVHEPDFDVVDDVAYEVVLGVNAGYWDRARLTLQAERFEAFRNFSKGYFTGPDPDQLALVAQAGVAF